MYYKVKNLKFFGEIRNVLKEKMHQNWAKKLLDEDGILNDKSYISCEIDEREIILNQNIIYWMFWIIDGRTKHARIFCILNNGTKKIMTKNKKQYNYRWTSK